MNPSNFISHPWDSVFQNNESETIARNIMVILARIGDKWRSLTWDEYASHRLSDGNFSEREKQYFDKVVDYCVSPETAKCFSPEWNKQK